MNGVPLLRIFLDQFVSKAPPSIAKPGIAWLQVVWLILSAVLGLAYSLANVERDVGASVLAANAVFTALSVTMAMFFWPRAINLKNDAQFALMDERWHVYRLTTQLFWTVLVGVTSTGLAVAQLVIASNMDTLNEIVESLSVGLTIYQVLLLAQSVFRLYAATFWMPKA
jgi:hypothetical protein